MEGNTGTGTPDSGTAGGWSTGKKLLVGGIVTVVLLGGLYIGYTKFYKKPQPGQGGDALPGGAGEEGASSESSNTTGGQSTGGGTTDTPAPKSQPGNTGIGGGGTKTTTGGGGSGGSGTGSNAGGSGNGQVRTGFDSVWNYQLRNGVWFTAKKSTPNTWISLAKNKAASDKLFSKYPKG